MAKTFTFRYKKWSCGFQADIEIELQTTDSDIFEIKFDILLDEKTKFDISKGIKKVVRENDLLPHIFTVTKVDDYMRDTSLRATPPLGVTMCAAGATKLALGLSE